MKNLGSLWKRIVGTLNRKIKNEDWKSNHMDVRKISNNFYFAIESKKLLFMRAYVPLYVTRGSYRDIFGAYFGQIKSDAFHSKFASLVDASYDNI